MGFRPTEGLGDLGEGLEINSRANGAGTGGGRVCNGGEGPGFGSAGSLWPPNLREVRGKGHASLTSVRTRFGGALVVMVQGRDLGLPAIVLASVYLLPSRLIPYACGSVRYLDECPTTPTLNSLPLFESFLLSSSCRVVCVHPVHDDDIFLIT